MNRIVRITFVGLMAASLATPAFAAKTKSFKTPEEAMKALVAAVEKQSKKDIEAIVGPEFRAAIQIDDEKTVSNVRSLFVRGAKEKTTFEPNPDDPKQKIAYIGEAEWPFPAPLVPDGKKWRFDGKKGVEEVRYRRIGRHELLAITACRAYVDAQQDYVENDHDDDGLLEFATKVNSTPGKQDGLYWSTAKGEDISPLGPFAAQAAAAEKQTTGKPEPLAGYFYRILTSQGANAKGGARNFVMDGNLLGGFGLVAWPAEYGESGFKTFIVNQLGQVYEKDFGSKTEATAQGLAGFDPDASWKLSDEIGEDTGD